MSSKSLKILNNKKLTPPELLVVYTKDVERLTDDLTKAILQYVQHPTEEYQPLLKKIEVLLAARQHLIDTITPMATGLIKSTSNSSSHGTRKNRTTRKTTSTSKSLQ